MNNIEHVAILYEEVNNEFEPVRAFKGPKCIYNAYKFAHYHYCLSDLPEKYSLHQLPKWLKVIFHLIDAEKFNELFKMVTK